MNGKQLVFQFTDPKNGKGIRDVTRHPHQLEAEFQMHMDFVSRFKFRYEEFINL